MAGAGVERKSLVLPAGPPSTGLALPFPPNVHLRFSIPLACSTPSLFFFFFSYPFFTHLPVQLLAEGIRREWRDRGNSKSTKAVYLSLSLSLPICEADVLTGLLYKVVCKAILYCLRHDLSHETSL